MREDVIWKNKTPAGAAALTVAMRMTGETFITSCPWAMTNAGRRLSGVLPSNGGMTGSVIPDGGVWGLITGSPDKRLCCIV